jgi:hypothetical protein
LPQPADPAKQQLTDIASNSEAVQAYGIHSGVNKILIINREITPGRSSVVLVDKALGF